MTSRSVAPIPSPSRRVSPQPQGDASARRKVGVPLDTMQLKQVGGGSTETPVRRW